MKNTEELEAVYHPMTKDGKEGQSKLMASSSYLLRPPCVFILQNYAALKRDDREWLSKPFYTGPKGYKMCLGVFPWGNGDGKRRNISVFIHMMKGEYDSELKWPFRGSVVVELLNQMADHTHHRRSIIFNDHSPDELSGRVTSGSERNEIGWGKPKFIPHSELGHKTYTWLGIKEYECQYLKENTLKFRVHKVVITSFYSSS